MRTLFELRKVYVFLNELPCAKQCLLDVRDHTAIASLRRNEQTPSVIVDLVVTTRICPVAKEAILGHGYTRVIEIVGVRFPTSVQGVPQNFSNGRKSLAPVIAKDFDEQLVAVINGPNPERT